MKVFEYHRSKKH